MPTNFPKIFLKTNFFALFHDFFIIYWLQLKIFFYLCIELATKIGKQYRIKIYFIYEKEDTNTR